MCVMALRSARQGSLSSEGDVSPRRARDPVLNWVIDGSIAVVSHRRGAPSAETWGRFVTDLRVRRPSRMVVLGAGDAHLRPTQRTDFKRCAKDIRQIVAVLDTLVSRAMATGLSWFMSNLVVFGHQDLKAAIAALDVSRVDKAWIAETLEDLRSPA